MIKTEERKATSVPILRDDRVFKKLFKRRVNRLVSLVNSIGKYAFTEDEIEFIDTELANESLQQKNSRLDLYVKGPNGERINIEIQNIVTDEFDVRRLHFSSLSVIDQIKRGKNYSLNKTISLYIVYDEKMRYPKSLINFQKYDKISLESKEKPEFIQDVVFVDEFIINLAKLEEDNRIEGEIHDFLSLFNAKDIEELKEMVKDNNEFDDVYDEVESITREYAYDLQKILEDQAMRDAYCEKERNIKAGIKQGLEQGLEQGIKQGLEQGLEQGMAKEKLHLAKKLLDILTDEQIAEKTDLNINVVKNIRTKNN